MQILLHVLFLIVGFTFLIKGADLFVVSSSSIARKFNVSPLIIGLTLVAFGTSLPELAVSFAASISASQQGITADIAMGNIIGSNISNLTLILGFTAVVMPVAVRRTMIRKEFPFLITTTVLILIFSLFFQANYEIVRLEALVLLAFFGYYLYRTFRSPVVPEEIDVRVLQVKNAVALLFIGIIGVSAGGYLVTTGAEYISIQWIVSTFGVSITKATTLVGLSVVALGTSLPELVTSVMAARKGENEIALGNVVGSNVFNTLLVIGLSGTVVPLSLGGEVIFDMLIAIVITLIVAVFAFTKLMISRKEGVILLVLYVLYIAFITIRGLGAF
ncbi:MAG: calcium/sodium antiporter [Acholeplasmataceae bacterium]